MKNTRLLLVIVLFLFFLNGAWGQITQWDTYKGIPNFKRINCIIPQEDIQITWRGTDGQEGEVKRGDGFSMEIIIYGDYTVKLLYHNPYQWENKKMYGGVSADLEMVGTGRILWQNEHMVLQMDVKKQGDGYYYTLSNGNEFIFEQFDETTSYVYDFEFVYDNQAEFFRVKGKDIVARRQYYMWNATTGEKGGIHYVTDRICLKKLIPYDVEMKSQSELNAESSDVYGKWQWNENRSVIYLPSTTNESYLCLWNNNGSLTWGFQLPSASTGYKTETTDGGEALAYMMLSFDGSSEQSFSFSKNELSDRTYYYYVQYDRFMGTLKRDASIINQIKDKRTLILSYKQHGQEKTAMFQLEGLEAIYNALNQ